MGKLILYEGKEVIRISATGAITICDNVSPEELAAALVDAMATIDSLRNMHRLALTTFPKRDSIDLLSR